MAEQKTKGAPAKKAEPKLVKMTKGNQTADVHPDMAEEYKKGGWVEA